MDTHLSLNLFAMSDWLACLGVLVFGGLVIAPAWSAQRRTRGRGRWRSIFRTSVRRGASVVGR